jgi:outer membrane protein assembly factor BamB
MFRMLTVACLAYLIPGGISAQDHWHQWRGPNQDGSHTAQDLPLEWSEADIVWRQELPGRGQSTPCLWGNKIFLTSEEDNGAKRLVYCLDKNSGKLLWQQTAWTGSPEQTHKLNGWASASCTTDGERVYAFFGKGGLHCYTVEGEPVWKKELGSFEGPWGTAASPVIVRGMLIQNCDADTNARLIAFDKVTGEEIWNTKREDARGWSTPILIEYNSREELVLNGDSRVTAYHPDSGEILWYCRSFSGRGEPVATFANGLVHMINGKPGDVYAVRPGGSGDVTETHMAWHTRRGGGRDLPSPVVIGKYMLAVNMDGVLACYESPTGKELWRERMGGKHVGSPITYRGRALLMDETGKVYVVNPGPKMDVERVNSIGNRGDEMFRSSLVPNNGQLYLRSTAALYKVGKSAK